jgi:hypothetical protein
MKIQLSLCFDCKQSLHTFHPTSCRGKREGRSLEKKITEEGEGEGERGRRRRRQG